MGYPTRVIRRKKASQNSADDAALSPARADSATSGAPEGAGTASKQRKPKGYSPRKGRPTPKRKVAQAANKRPIVPADKKAARREARRLRNEEYARQQQAMISGDERAMPYNHRGRARRYARDYVDARWNVGELFMPLAVLLLVLMFASGLPQVRQLVASITVGVYLFILIAMMDSILVGFRVVKTLRNHLPADEIPKWTRMYTFTRTMYVRPMRMPKPQVKRGDYPTPPGVRKSR